MTVDPAHTAPNGPEGKPESALLAGLSAEQQIELLRDMFDAIPDAVMAHDPGGQLLFYSQGARELLQYSREEMDALKPFGWVAALSMRGSPGRLETILNEGSLTFESSIRRRDGSVLPTSVDAHRIDTAEGPIVVAVVRDLTVRTQARDQLVYLAYHDSLTGLYNRAALDDRLRFAVADVRRHGDPLALAYVDLDGFKPVNDRFGHETGDGVLISVALRLTASVREQDTVARLGGDEFVILLPRTSSPEELAEIAERLIAAIRRPISSCGAECGIDASVGFAVFDPETDDERSLVVKADQAMYAAKRDPEHHWRIWEPGMGPAEAAAHP